MTLNFPEGCDRPIIIGEFHFGVLGRGMFHHGLRQADSQKHRAKLYTDYLHGALENPQIVGGHWFQYSDQHTTGRVDGENFQIGFISITDVPHSEIIEASREVAESLYHHRTQKQ
ncbi:MAG: hypothetical protein GY762_24185 [Proteobacteria bacterium]|nr:hypothetical protein [Pseudomonadota bacterium]